MYLIKHKEKRNNILSTHINSYKTNKDLFILL